MVNFLEGLARDAAATVLSPASRFYLPYLYVTLLIAVAVLYLRTGSLSAAMRGLWRKDVFLHRSSMNDYRIAAINTVLIAAFFTLGIANAAGIASGTIALMEAAFGPAPQQAAGLFGAVAYTVAVLIAYDGGNFAQHWLQHKIPFLWELHKVHHSAEVMTPVTAVRVHPLSAFFAAVFLSILFGLTNGVFLYLYGGRVAELTLLGVNVFLVLHYSVGVYHLQHSHIWLSFPRPFRVVFASPAMHMIHHSANPRHFDKNFGFVLTLWDWLAGSLYIPEDAEQEGLTLGLLAPEQAEMQTTWQLYSRPLRRIAGMARARRRPRA